MQRGPKFGLCKQYDDLPIVREDERRKFSFRSLMMICGGYTLFYFSELSYFVSNGPTEAVYELNKTFEGKQRPFEGKHEPLPPRRNIEPVCEINKVFGISSST